jgi:hypothetical protein
MRLSFAPFGPPDEGHRARDAATDAIAPAPEDRAVPREPGEDEPATAAVQETVGPTGTAVFGTVDVAEAGARETVGAPETGPTEGADDAETPAAEAPAARTPRPRRPRTTTGRGRRTGGAAEADTPAAAPAPES